MYSRIYYALLTDNNLDIKNITKVLSVKKYTQLKKRGKNLLLFPSYEI